MTTHPAPTDTPEAPSSKVSIDEWRSVLKLDPETGVLTWTYGMRHLSKRAGTEEGDGYRYVMYRGRKTLEHRIVWALFHGSWPKTIDHKNMVRSDNRIANLREASMSQNNSNRGLPKHNTSGFKGVYFHKNSGKFIAKITVNHKTTQLGVFTDAKSAAAAYAEAAQKHHGEFAHFPIPEFSTSKGQS